MSDVQKVNITFPVNLTMLLIEKLNRKNIFDTIKYQNNNIILYLFTTLLNVLFIHMLQKTKSNQ